jgi:hypothetical protein
MSSQPLPDHVVHLPPSDLLRFAACLRAKTAREAHGCCLHATVTLANEAVSHGLQSASLVVWDVKGDIHFRDHWALGLGPSTVMDPTRMQVDSRKGLVFHMRDYPENYGTPRSYPLQAVTGLLQEYAHAGNERLHWSWVQRLRGAMCRYDVQQGLLRLQPSRALKALRAYAGFTVRYAFQRLEYRLLKRLQLLQARCDEVDTRRHEIATRY